jgi:phage terminase large subunit GpA-like protein
MNAAAQIFIEIDQVWQSAIEPALSLIRPKPRISVSEWANKERILSPESCAEPGKYFVERFEPQRGIQDAFSDPHIEQVIVMSSSQVGKTTIVENVIGFYIDQNPSPILWIEPTLELAKSMSKDRLDPMVRDTPALKGKIHDAKSRDSENTILHKRFVGGHITLAGANSSASLAGRPIRVVLCDEVDRYPFSAGEEGDPVDLAFKRATTFWNKKLGMFSTPTIKGQSRIEAAYSLSDRRKYWVPCPKCGEFQLLKWTQVKWPKENPAAAKYHCEYCQTEITDSDKIRMVRNGEWRAEGETKGVAGFWINELYSPWVSFGNMATRFIEAKRRGKEALQVFINTSLAETWEEQTTVDIETLKGKLIFRREDYGCDTIIKETGEVVAPEWVVPMSAGAITIACDVQDDRIEALPVAWGEGDECWPLSIDIFYGHTAVNSPGGPWEQLDIYLMKTWQHENLIDSLPASIVFIDSSYLRQVVGEFTKPRTPRNIFAIRGSSEPRHELVSGQKLDKKNRIPTYYIGTNQAKDILRGRLQLETPGPGYIHFNKKLDTLFFDQLISSEYKDPQTRTWKKKTASDSNEGLDLMVYSIAAWHRFIHDTKFDIGAKVQELKARAGIKAAQNPPPRGPQVRRRIISSGIE